MGALTISDSGKGRHRNFSMEWFPRWPGLLLSPASSSSPRRHHLRGNGTSRGDIVKGSPSSSSPSTHSLGSSGEPPPPQPIRRRWLFVVMALSLVCFLSAVALFDLGRSPASPKVGVGSSGSGGNKTESANNADAAAPVTPASVLDLPYLVADKNNSLAKPEPSRPGWVRVVSAKAAHPAMYVPADGLIYCPIAKVACAEWRKTLRWMLGIPDWDTGPIHDQGKNGIPLVAGRKPRDVELMMNDDSWLKFVVVRDPADRLLSGFLNKCAGGEWQNCPYVEFMPQRFEGLTTRNAQTDAKFMQAIRDEPRYIFRDFMEGVLKDVRTLGCKVNSHWRPQYCFCSIARFMDSYHVIPFSNMSMEAVTLVDHMQRPSPERADLLREFIVNRFSSNQDAKAQGAATKRERYFSEEALKIIRQVYTKDYKLFGEHFEEHTATPL